MGDAIVLLVADVHKELPVQHGVLEVRRAHTIDMWTEDSFFSRLFGM